MIVVKYAWLCVCLELHSLHCTPHTIAKVVREVLTNVWHVTSLTREVLCIDDCSDGDGSLDAVHPQMPCQVALLAGAVIAVRTVEALLPSVYQLCISRCLVR